MNTLFPGRPNYVGPVEGLFSLLHHTILVEESHNVMERIIYIKNHKPRNEVSIRLHNIMYLGNGEAGKTYILLEKDYYTKHKFLKEDYITKHNFLYKDYSAKCILLEKDTENKSFGEDYYPKLKILKKDYEIKRTSLYEDFVAKYYLLKENFKVKCKPLENEILKYIKQYISDCAWDGKSLVF